MEKCKVCNSVLSAREERICTDCKEAKLTRTMEKCKVCNLVLLAREERICTDCKEALDNPPIAN